MTHTKVIPHGTGTGYRYGCRCVECAAAKKSERLRYRDSGKSQARWRRWYDQNAAARRSYSSRWTKNNPDLDRDRYMRRRAIKRGSTCCVVTTKDWRRLVARFRGCCAYCGQQRALEQEHVVPLSRGGRHSIGNVLPVCKRCNCEKHNRLLVEWRYR